MKDYDIGYASIYTILCIVIVSVMMYWVFNKTTIHPEYNLTLDGETTPIFGPVPLQRDIGTTRDGSGVGTPSDITDNLNQMVKGTYYNGTNTPKPSSNVCNDTLTCFPDNVDPHLCSTTNCDSLWNIMKNTTPKSGEKCCIDPNNHDTCSSTNCSGMTGVNIALNKFTTKEHLGYLKNQIRHLLCKLASQNVYKYDSSYGGFNMAMLTMSGIWNLNGWHDRTSPAFIIYVVSIIIVSSLVLKMITLKLWEATRHNDTPSLFKLLLIGSTGAEKGWNEGKVEKVLYISLSFLMYFCTIKYITTSILYIDAIETGKEETDVSGPLLQGYGGAALGGVLVPLVLFLLSALLTKKTNHISVYITGVQLTLIGLYTAYMFYVAKHATENSAGLKLDLNEGTGLQWDNINSSPKGGSITESNSSNPILTNLKNFAIMAGVSIILFISSLISGNSSKQANKNDKPTNNCDTIIKQFNDLENITNKYKKMATRLGLTFVSILLMIIYIVLAGTNVFVGICYPQIYIILLVFQRLIITNLVAFDEKDWHRNWHPILFPMLSKTISLLLVKEECRKQKGYEENLLGTSNYKVFGRGPISMNSWPFFSYPSAGNFLSNSKSKIINGIVDKWDPYEIIKQSPSTNIKTVSNQNLKNIINQLGGSKYKDTEIRDTIDIIQFLIKQNLTIKPLTKSKQEEFKKHIDKLKKIYKSMQKSELRTLIDKIIKQSQEYIK